MKGRRRVNPWWNKSGGLAGGSHPTTLAEVLRCGMGTKEVRTNNKPGGQNASVRLWPRKIEEGDLVLVFTISTGQRRNSQYDGSGHRLWLVQTIMWHTTFGARWDQNRDTGGREADKGLENVARRGTWFGPALDTEGDVLDEEDK